MKNIQTLIIVLTFSALNACGTGEDSTTPFNPDAPVLASIGDQPVLAGSTLSFTMSASDVNSNNLTFSAAATGTDPRSLTPPAVFSTNSNQVSATFTWTPKVSQIGTYNMRFTVTDDSMETLSDSETISISVLDSIGQGRVLYRDNCGSCHGFEGVTGSSFGVGAPTEIQMTQAFDNVGVMSKFRNNFFSDVQLTMMYNYMCSLPENNLC